MTTDVLYYPFIQVPNNEWFTRVLLYWDTVGSIVPYEYTQEPERLGPYMQSLLTEGLVRQVIPGLHVYRVRNFANSFIQFAEGYRSQLMLTTRDLSELPTFRVHAEKLDQIGEHLCQMGLARRAEYPWYDVESQLASIFMASLAGLLSKIPEFNARPITDQQSEIALFESSESTRSSILASLLPAPSDEITAAHLAHFKSKHARLLRGFRNTIESFLLQLGAVSQPDLKSEMIEHFIQSAQEEINTIVDAMQTQGWKRITKGKFLSYTAAGATLANAIASGGILGIIAAAFGVANAAYKTIQGTKVPDAFQGSFVAYAAVAQTL